MVDLFSFENRVKAVNIACQRDGKHLVFSLSSSVELNAKSYWGGVRVTDSFIIISLINVSQSQITSYASVLGVYADYIFVDTEKKHPFEVDYDTLGSPQPMFSNLFSASLDLFDSSKVIPWSPSRITSDASISRIRNIFGGNLNGATCSVVGIGNIGFKIALGLIEEGCDVIAYGRNQERLIKLVDSMNLIKSDYTLASAAPARNLDLAMARSRASVLVASSSSYISKRQLQLLGAPLSEILDVSKFSLDLEARKYALDSKNIIYTRLDIGRELVAMVGSYLSSYSQIYSQMNPARRPFIESKSGFCVSGGFPGSVGDVVVDNAYNPSFVLGSIGDHSEFISDFYVID